MREWSEYILFIAKNEGNISIIKGTLFTVSHNKTFFQGKPAITEVIWDRKGKKDSLHKFSISALLFRITSVVYAGDSLDNNPYLEPWQVFDRI